MQVLEYEETNNNNIESSMRMIDDLKTENEFFRKKLLDNYQLLEKYEDDYGDAAILSDYTHGTLQKFLRKYSALKVFSVLKENVRRIKIFKQKFGKFNENLSFVRKIKAFLSLQKNLMIEKYSHKLLIKKCFQTYKDAFNTLKQNLFFSKLSNRFFHIQRTIRLIYYFKTIRINLGRKKVNSIYHNKGWRYYYKRKTRTVFDVLKYNVYYNKEKGISHSKTSGEASKFNNDKRISFLNYLKMTNGLELDPALKERKFKSLKILRQLYDVTFV